MPTRRRRNSLLGAVLLAAHALGQAPAKPPAPPEYPYDLVPVDAIYGHLSEGAFSEPVGVCFDAEARELLVADSKNGLIGIYNSELTPVFAFGGPATLVEPLKVRALPGGNICVLDALQTELRRFTYRGDALPGLRFLHEPSPGATPEAVRIHSFEIAADGRWFIGAQEKDAGRLFTFDRDGKFVRELEVSKKAGSFRSIVDMALSREGRLAVVDQACVPAIHVYEPDGTLSAAFGAHDVGLQDFTAPIAVAFDEEGYLYAVDLLKHDVKIFTVKGDFLGHFGGWTSTPTRGRGPGELLYPVDIACAPGGRIFVAERYGQRVQVFERRAKPAPKLAAAPAVPAR
jgi:hypothetical protein